MPFSTRLQPEGSSLHACDPHPDVEVLTPALFTRHKRQLRALLLDEEPWFAVHDLARLMNHAPLPERVRRNLDADQWQLAWLRNGHGEYQQELLISESGVYATLIHFYHPENCCIRQWITQEVVPRLREEERLHRSSPRRARVQWLGQEVEVLYWQGKAWLALNDCPQLVQAPPQVVG